MDSSSGFLAVTVDGMVAEHLRRVIGEKTRDALAHLRAEGPRYARIPPYGYRVAAAGTLEADAAEQATLARMRALRAGWLSLTQIAAALARRGPLARNGKPFTAKVVRALVTDRAIGNSRAAV